MSTGAGANWHPLTWISHMLDCSLFGVDPAGPHLVNVALHAANAVLLLWALTALTKAPVCQVERFRPLAAFQTLTVLSRLAEKTVRPSGANARLMTAARWPFQVEIFLPVPTSQSLIAWSSPPETALSPEGAKAMQRTVSAWPAQEPICDPEDTSQSFTSLSEPPADNNLVPSGENRTMADDETHWETTLPEARSHSLTPVGEAEAISRPSGE